MEINLSNIITDGTFVQTDRSPRKILEAPVLIDGSALTSGNLGAGFASGETLAGPSLPSTLERELNTSFSDLQRPESIVDAMPVPVVQKQPAGSAVEPVQIVTPKPQTSPPPLPALQLPIADLSATPTEVVTSFQDALKMTMMNADQLGMVGRFRALEPVIQRTFDLTLLSKIIAGAEWGNWTELQRNELKSALEDYITSTYARQFDGYTGEHFEVGSSRRGASGTLVATTMYRLSDPPVSVSYLVGVDVNQTYRIIDVLIGDSTSELAARRSEFGSVLKQSGFTGLIKDLKDHSSP
jgi:phospholipid transport system substrate-binding protein